MLSRSAHGLYWMGRYLERAGHLARLLRVQTEVLVDRPTREIRFGWHRLYGALGRPAPTGGAFAPDASEAFALADSYTLADDLTFERSNPQALRSCLAMGRENARQMRHCISAEMWSCLNLAWLRVRPLTVADIWRSHPEDFYTATWREIATFMGVAEATMYRGEGWRFMRAGRFIERAQLTVALLLAQLAAARRHGGEDSDWTGLLRACEAGDAYGRRHGVAIHPERVLDVVATDPLLPGSLCHSLAGAAGELAALGPAPDAEAGAAAKRLAAGLALPPGADWPGAAGRRAALVATGKGTRRLHDLLFAAYIDYAIDDSPAA